jgi:imidazole glycerol-phosphate synthase subunit HisF
MLKKRLAACLVVKDGINVQSINFNRYLPIGNPEISAEYLNKWGIDEIILLDISNNKNHNSPDIEMIRRISKKCFVPLAVGGGIKNIEDINSLIRNGADKIVINSLALKKPEIITEASSIFGDQCIIVSIDVKKNEFGEYKVYNHKTKQCLDLNPIDFAKKVAKLGAGEILLNSVDRDGSKKGYDLELVQLITDSVSIPVIAIGGASHPSHFEEGLLKGNASALAAANYFNFTEHSVIITKQYLRKSNDKIRLDSYATYDEFNINKDHGRIKKLSDEKLEEFKFKYELEEVI